MLCYKNGALAREEIRDRYASGTWSKFNELVEASPPGNNGYFGLYFPLPEIIPPNVQGRFLFALANGTGQPAAVAEIPDVAHPRAILESQFLSIRSRVEAVLPPSAPPLERLIITGGTSSNPTIRQLLADVFGMRVFVIESNFEGAATGGAILARYAWLQGEGKSYGMARNVCAQRGMKITMVAEPQKGGELSRLYGSLIEAYVACEDHAMRVFRDGN